MSKPDKPWEGFNGTPEEWAWYTLETFELPAAFEDDNIYLEMMYKLMLKTQKDLRSHIKHAESIALDRKFEVQRIEEKWNCEICRISYERGGCPSHGPSLTGDIDG